MTDNKEIPIPDVITRVGVENLGKRVRKLISKKGLKCTDKQLQKIFIIGIIMVIIGSTGLGIILTFPPTNITYLILEPAIFISLEILGLMIILPYILRREEFKRFFTMRRIKLAERDAEYIEKKMKKK